MSDNHPDLAESAIFIIIIVLVFFVIAEITWHILKGLAVLKWLIN